MSTLVEQLQPELLNIARKQSFKEGFEKACEQLRPKFLQEGRQEERREIDKEKRATAKTLLSKGVSIDIIAEATKLSEKELKNLVH